MSESSYLRDLSVRQNREITSAQLHSYENTKRYSCKEIQVCTEILKGRSLMSAIQKDLTGNSTGVDLSRGIRDETSEIEVLKRKIKELEEELKNKRKEIEKAKPENYFVYKNKLIVMNDTGNLMLKYKEDLFIELIKEFTLMYEWLDRKSAYLKFSTDTEENVVIDKTEIKTVIKFFDKLNKLKSSDK